MIQGWLLLLVVKKLGIGNTMDNEEAQMHEEDKGLEEEETQK